jgi:hypothetical protein
VKVTPAMATLKMSTEGLVESNNSGKLLQQLENYIIVDIGANLTNKKFSKDLDSVLQRAKDSGNQHFNS